MNNRQEAIDFFTRLQNCEDLTSERHPNKIGKRFFRFKFEPDNYINFNIDYEGYEYMSVFDDKGNISGMLRFEDLINFLNENQISPEWTDNIEIGKSKIIFL